MKANPTPGIFEYFAIVPSYIQMESYIRIYRYYKHMYVRIIYV